MAFRSCYRWFNISVSLIEVCNVPSPFGFFIFVPEIYSHNQNNCAHKNNELNDNPHFVLKLQILISHFQSNVGIQTNYKYLYQQEFLINSLTLYIVIIMNKKGSNEYYLPKIKSKYIQYYQKSEEGSRGDAYLSKVYSNKSKILNEFQKQLASKSMFKSIANPSRKVQRARTLGHQQSKQVLSLKKQLLVVKDSLSHKIIQQNHKLQLKMVELSAMMQKQNTRQLYQNPIPIYIPMMQPFNHYYPPSNYHSVPLKHYKTRNVSKKYSKKARGRQNLRKFKIAANAILFTIYLRKFVERIVQYRKQAFSRFLSDSQFKSQVNQIKATLVESSQEFFRIMLQKQDTQYKIQQNDQQFVKKQKKLAARKLINIIIQALYDATKDNNFANFATPIYYFCKHGSFACSNNLLTLQQLEQMSISSKHSYLQAQKNLQKSQIINFIFMKILLFNILAQPFKIDSQAFSDKPVLQDNILLITSIFYQILMDIQDDYTVESPSCYVLGNFNHAKQKILPSVSLTLKQGQYRKNQMVSGFYNQNYVKSIYKTEKTWIEQKNKLIEIIQNIHKIIVNYHKELIKRFF